MTIRAHVQNEADNHQVTLTTNEHTHNIDIAPKSSGQGSSINGGEMLLLALATCYCNDVYREAAKLDIEILSVEVEVTGEFGGVGEPAQNLSYVAKAKARDTSEQVVTNLLRHTDQVAEVQNTLRLGLPVILSKVAAEIVG